MRTLTCLLATSLLTAGSLSAQAKVTNQHDGFWIGFGLGGGRTGGSNSQSGGGGYVRLGGTPIPQLLVGGEGIAWVRAKNNTTVSDGNATANIQFYPSLGNEFFLKVGLGFASVTQSATSGNTTVTISNNGFGSTFGVGYDIKLGRNIYLTPNFDTLVQVINNSTRTVFLLTVGLTWH